MGYEPFNWDGGDTTRHEVKELQENVEYTSLHRHGMDTTQSESEDVKFDRLLSRVKTNTQHTIRYLIPFEFTIKLPPPKSSRKIAKRNELGQIIASQPVYKTESICSL